MEYVSIFVIGFIGIFVLIIVVSNIFSNPYKYPYYVINIGVTGKRKVNIDDEIELYLIKNKDTFLENTENYIKSLNDWKDRCKKSADKSLISTTRNNQLNSVIDDNRMFNFKLYRVKTRYRQVNYVKHPYTVNELVKDFHCNYDYLLDKYNFLKSIDFETTSSKYNSKNQRKLMTPKLRKTIMERDNYTCQMCGKYMPDEVGLHIDHIIPVSKGGKTVESNLQVLCSKCNGRKSNK